MDSLKDLRIAANLTQVDVAKKLNVTQAAISHWDLGFSTPCKKYRKKLAKCYGVTLDEINTACEKAE